MKISVVRSDSKGSLRKVGIRLGLTLLLAVTPLVALGLTGVESSSVTLAGSSYPDEVDPG